MSAFGLLLAFLLGPFYVEVLWPQPNDSNFSSFPFFQGDNLDKQEPPETAEKNPIDLFSNVLSRPPFFHFTFLEISCDFRREKNPDVSSPLLHVLQ